MALLSSTVGLLYEIRGDDSNVQQVIERVARKVDSETSGITKSFGGTTEAINSLGSAITSVGAALTASLTIPLTAIGTLGIKAALGIDEVRTKITALVGDAGAANRKIAELQKLANDSVGVTQTAALSSFAQLKGIGGIADATINKVIASIGRLNAAFNIQDAAGFQQNLNQIFTQGFERSDIKEAIGRVPIFEQLLEQAFGTKDGEKLKALKESGKLTLDGFLSGISGAIESDPRLAKIQENLSIKLAKSFERLNVALAPIGQIILDVVVPAVERAVPYLESLVKYFSELSSPVQTAVVAFGALAAALGPALIAVGSVVALIGTIASSVVTIGGVAVIAKGAAVAVLAIAGAFAQVVPFIAAAAAQTYLLYQAWQTNFGGIREFTLQAWEAVKSATEAALTFLRETVGTVGGQIVAWWRDNYPIIQQIVAKVSFEIASTIQRFLANVQAFWSEYGERILAVVRAVWNVISTAIKAALDVIGGIVRVGLQAVNGDWQGAWNTFLKILQNAVRFAVTHADQMVELIKKALAFLVPVAIEYATKFGLKLAEWIGKAIVWVVDVFATLPIKLLALVPKLILAGRQIAAAIWQGIREGLSGTGTQVNVQGEAVALVGSGSAEGRGDFVAPTQTPEESEKRRKEREDIAKRDAAAQISILKNQLSDAEKLYNETLDRLREKFRSDKDKGAFETAIIEAAKVYAAELRDILPLLRQLEDQQAAAEKRTAKERDLLADEQSRRAKGITDRAADEINKNSALIKDIEKKGADDRFKLTEASASRRLELEKAAGATRIAQLEAILKKGLLDEEQYARAVGAIKINLLELEKSAIEDLLKTRDLDAEKREELNQRLKVLNEEIRQQELENAAAIEEALERMQTAREKALGGKPGENNEGEQGELGGFLGGFFGTLSQALEASQIKLLDWSQVVQSVGASVANVFLQMGQAVGNMIQQWVLLGNASDFSMKKMLASVLAGVAAQAATLAVFHTAMGIAALTPWGAAVYGNPALHFKAAALWAGIAAVAAVAGRGVAGNSFRQQASQATGAGAPAGGTGSRGQAGAYSGQEEGTVNVSRNSPSGSNNRATLVLKVDDRSGWFSQIFKMEWENNAPFRNFVLKEIEQS